MHGYYNRILTVDLTCRDSRIEDLSDEVLASCHGGKGLATHLLLERNPVGVDPLGPDNNLVVATGPFCGGTLWGGSRFGV